MVSALSMAAGAIVFSTTSGITCVAGAAGAAATIAMFCFDRGLHF
jgi:hypothetical protein